MVGREASDHLVDEHAKCIPVYGFVVSLLVDQLGSKIVRSAAQRPSSCSAVFGEPEIGQFDMTISGEEDVFRFEIAINDPLFVQVVER